ncbi:mgpp2cl-1, protein phosphatase 2C-like protein 1 [Rhizina undulata]
MLGNSNSSSSTTNATTATPVVPLINTSTPPTPTSEKKRSGSSKATAFIKNTLTSLNSSESKESKKMSEETQASSITNNSAGDQKPSPQNTFRVGVTEDRNRKCRRTMEDTHAYVYNFLQPASTNASSSDSKSAVSDEIVESDNGYFAIFDGHAGTYAADWCGKRLHIVLEETIRKYPNMPVPELLDMTFTNCDSQLEKLPVKNSGCTAVCAVLRWEARVLGNTASAEGGKGNSNSIGNENVKPGAEKVSSRQRVLYTANVGDARIVLCRGGKALRLSYDHKGSDENEGKRVANAGGLILNNRVNGVLAVTRALGDSYMKDLVTGHPYTTETVLQPDSDEFIILACDGLWDVCSDQEAVDLVRNVLDPQLASKMLVEYALSRFSSDNLSCMIVRLDPSRKFVGSKDDDVLIEEDEEGLKAEKGNGVGEATLLERERATGGTTGSVKETATGETTESAKEAATVETTLSVKATGETTLSAKEAATSETTVPVKETATAAATVAEK